MRTDASGRQARPQVQVARQALPGLPCVDVSKAASYALMHGTVLMDPEAFGVTVTRRPTPGDGDWTAEERTRLLDVLCHAQAIQRSCAIEGEITFPIWIVSSDARDARPRSVWLVLSAQDDGTYLISLSDL